MATAKERAIELYNLHIALVATDGRNGTSISVTTDVL
jgi:hypothetical protein